LHIIFKKKKARLSSPNFAMQNLGGQEMAKVGKSIANFLYQAHKCLHVWLGFLYIYFYIN